VGAYKALHVAQDNTATWVLDNAISQTVWEFVKTSPKLAQKNTFLFVVAMAKLTATPVLQLPPAYLLTMKVSARLIDKH
jgi:hypothetical protein